jgi:holliday junction DNA helicase RuvA
MIHSLSGVLKYKDLSGLIVEVTGVGYGVEFASVLYPCLPELGEKITLSIYTRVKEDELKLYGFLEKIQRDLFAILLNISGVGPKLALALIASLSVAEIVNAVELKDSDPFENVPGIGKRSAEKILIELQAKLKKIRALTSAVPPVDNDTLKTTKSNNGKTTTNNLLVLMKDLASTLENLGYKDRQINSAIKSLKTSYAGEKFEVLIRKALDLLRKDKIKDDISTKKFTSVDIQKIF